VRHLVAVPAGKKATSIILVKAMSSKYSYTKSVFIRVPEKILRYQYVIGSWLGNLLGTGSVYDYPYGYPELDTFSRDMDCLLVLSVKN